MRRQRDGSRNEANTLGEKLKAALEKVERVRKERDAATKSYRDMSKTISDASATWDSEKKSLHRKLDRAQGQREALNQEAQSLKGKLEIALARVASIAKEHDDAKGLVMALTDTFGARYAEFSRKSATHESKIESLSKGLEEAKRLLTGSHIKRGELQDQIYDLRDLSSKKDAQLGSMSARLQQSEQSLQSAQAQISQLSSDVNLRVMNANALREQLNKSRHNVVEPRAELDALHQDLCLAELKLRDEAQISAGPPDGLPSSREPDTSLAQEADDAISLIPDCPVADDAAPELASSVKEELHQFNASISEAALKLSTLVEELHLEDGTPPTICEDDGHIDVRAHEILGRDLVQDLLERRFGSEEVGAAQLRSLAQFVANRLLVWWSQGIFEGHYPEALANLLVDVSRATENYG